MNRTQLRNSANNMTWHKAGLTGLLLCCAVGCQGLFRRDDPMALHDPFSDGYQETASINDVKGPMERILQTGHSANSTNPNSLQSQNNQDFGEFNSAKRLFEQGNYAGAESAFKKIAESHSLDDTGVKRKRRWKDFLKPSSELKAQYSDSPLREDSLFMLAESQFKQDEYPGAETTYLRLLEEFPNSRHMDTATQRLFDIALTFDYVISESETDAFDENDNIDCVGMSREMNLNALIEDELLIAIPLAPTHQPACKPLTTESGEKHNSFSALKNLIK